MKRRTNKPNINIYNVPCSIPQLAGASRTDGTFLSVPICYQVYITGRWYTLKRRWSQFG